jgi:DNA-binding NarL/FixJ family response regulator
MNNELAILIVDDHRVFAEGLASVLRISFPNAQFEILHSGEQAWGRIVESPSFQLVITDISMAEMTGLALATRIKKNYPSIKVLILSMHNERQIVSSAMDTEAEGFVLKSSSSQEIVAAIHDILNDRTHYSREILSILLEKVKEERKQEEVNIFLTEREVEIVKLITAELSSDEIAEKLFISKRTVDTHRANIMEKTGCKNLIALFKFAYRHKLAKL